MNASAQPSPEKPVALHPASNMRFLDHLQELRIRVIRCLIAIAIGFIPTYFFAEKILKVLLQPVLNVLENTQGVLLSSSLHFTGLTEPFLVHLKVGFWSAFVLALPVIFYQIWQFAAPGLYRQEKWGLSLTVMFSTVFFLAGMAFAYFIVFPVGFKFFLSFTDPTIQPVLTLNSYLNLTLRFFIGFGLVFELPLIISILALAGLVNAKQLIGFWRYALVGTALVSAVLTPPDVASMVLMMAPILILYGLSVGLAALLKRNSSH